MMRPTVNISLQNDVIPAFEQGKDYRADGGHARAEDQTILCVFQGT